MDWHRSFHNTFTLLYTCLNIKFSQPGIKCMKSHSELAQHSPLLHLRLPWHNPSSVAHIMYPGRQFCKTADHTFYKWRHTHLHTHLHTLPHNALRDRAVMQCHGWQQLLPITGKAENELSRHNATGWAGLPMAMAELPLCLCQHNLQQSVY